MRGERVGAVLLATVLALAPGTGLAESSASPKADLSRIEKSIREEKKHHEEMSKKAESLASDLKAVRRRMVAAAATVQKHENELSALERRMRDLQRQQKAMQGAIDRRGRQMVTVIAALQRLAFRPTEALIAQPTPPGDTVRSAILLRAAVPSIEASAKEIRGDLEKIAAFKAQVHAQKDRIAAVTADLARTHDELKALSASKAAMQQRAVHESEASAGRMESLTREAKDLKDLIARLEAERARQRALAKKQAEERAKAARTAPRAALSVPAPAPRGFGKTHGRLPLPAVGEVVRSYGQPTPAGIHTRGITIATRPRAQVITPYDGVVLFAGPFRGYGQLLIIEYGDGYHILLAGMDRIDASVGQSLLAGEPIGVMNDTSSPELYVELRREGQPINPLPWLTAGKGKGQG